RSAHTLCHDACDDIARAAGWEWDNHRDRSNWIALRLRNEWHGAEAHAGHQTGQLDHGTDSSSRVTLADLVVVARPALETTYESSRQHTTATSASSPPLLFLTIGLA